MTETEASPTMRAAASANADLRGMLNSFCILWGLAARADETPMLTMKRLIGESLVLRSIELTPEYEVPDRVFAETGVRPLTWLCTKTRAQGQPRVPDKRARQRERRSGTPVALKKAKTGVPVLRRTTFVLRRARDTRLRCAAAASLCNAPLTRDARIPAASRADAFK
jgi:hypothetical protein